MPELDTPENHARLAEIRAEELAEALRRLGGIESRLLGYEDSGMMGTPDNDDPASFWQADLDEAIGRTVRVVRDVKPDVIRLQRLRRLHPDHPCRAGRRPPSAGGRDGLPRRRSPGIGAPGRRPLMSGSLQRARALGATRRARIKAWWLPDEASEEERIEAPRSPSAWPPPAGRPPRASMSGPIRGKRAAHSRHTSRRST